jgi:hypothetical protein
LENTLNNGCAGGKPVFKTGGFFGRPLCVSDFVALNGKGVANSELEGMWKATVLTQLRQCSGI